MEHDQYDKGGMLASGLVAVERAALGGAGAVSQIRWGLDYIDRTYGTRRSRAKRHLRRAWSELRAALAEYR